MGKNIVAIIYNTIPESLARAAEFQKCLFSNKKLDFDPVQDNQSLQTRSALGLLDGSRQADRHDLIIQSRGLQQQIELASMGMTLASGISMFLSDSYPKGG